MLMRRRHGGMQHHVADDARDGDAEHIHQHLAQQHCRETEVPWTMHGWQAFVGFSQAVMALVRRDPELDPCGGLRLRLPTTWSRLGMPSEVCFHGRDRDTYATWPPACQWMSMLSTQYPRASMVMTSFIQGRAADLDAAAGVGGVDAGPDQREGQCGAEQDAGEDDEQQRRGDGHAVAQVAVGHEHTEEAADCTACEALVISRVYRFCPRWPRLGSDAFRVHAQPVYRMQMFSSSVC